MSSLKYLFKNKIFLIYFLFAIISRVFILCHGKNTYDLQSFEKAKSIFSRPKSIYGKLNSKEMWELADREISFLNRINFLPNIYKGKGGRDMFVSIEILQACERLLNRIEMDSYNPVYIDSDSNIIGLPVQQDPLNLGMRVAREIQYCFLQYGSEVLQIPALERYSKVLRNWGVNRIFTDKDAKKTLDLLAEKLQLADDQHNSDNEYKLIKLSSNTDSDRIEKYLTLDPREPLNQKRKPINTHYQVSKFPKTEKEQENIEPKVKRIIARPNKATRQKISDLGLENNISGRLNELKNHPLASKKSIGINILQLIKQDDISDQIRSLGPEAQLLLAWQSVVEAKDKFNEDSDYYVKNLPDAISTTLLYQSSPDFSFLNFQKGCLEILSYRNSQIEKGFINGEQTLFYLKDGDLLITSKHIINTAAMQLCNIAQEFYLPNIIKNSKEYIEKLNILQSEQENKEEIKESDLPESSITLPNKPQDARSRLFESYKKVITKKGALALLNVQDSIWDELKECSDGNCVNEIVYRDLSYWLLPSEYLLNLIFQFSTENYGDSLLITDYSQSAEMKIGNIFDSNGINVFKFCSTYLKNLVMSGKADLVLGGVYTNLDNVIEELCKEITLELTKNESFLMDKRLLIGTLYELELLFCNILGVAPKARSTDKSNAKTELEALSSSQIDLGRDIWAIEECGLISNFELNYSLCLGSFAQGFIANLFPNSKESVIPITLICKAFIDLEKNRKNPYNPHEMGSYLAKTLFEKGLNHHFPFSSGKKNSQKITRDFFIELCKQFKMNHDTNFYIDSTNIIESIEAVHSSRLCSAPLFAFLPFDITFSPIDKELIDSLIPYGFRVNFDTNSSPGNIQPCLGIQDHIINYLHVLAAIIELFTVNYIDLDKIGTNKIEIPVNLLCLWWKHPVKNSLNNVLGNILPFMKHKEVSEYVLRYSLMMESVNFPAPVKSEKRIEYVYSTQQIFSNRAIDLPKKAILPTFNPPLKVFDELKYYLRKNIVFQYKQLRGIDSDEDLEELNFELISNKCTNLQNWQIYLAIAFQNAVTIILKMVLSRLNFKTRFTIPIPILCSWIANTFPQNFQEDQFLTSSYAGKLLEEESKGTLFWLQESMGEYLLSNFNIWSQTAFALKLGGVSKNKKLDPEKIILSDIKYLFDQRVQSVVDTSEEPKILNLNKLNIITKLKLNPFIDETLALKNPELKLECNHFWLANLMNAFRIYFLEFQRKYIDPLFHGDFDPFVMCEIIKEIVKNKVFQSKFGDNFYRVFKQLSWINNMQLVRILVKNASDWILKTFDLPGYPAYNTLQYNDNNLLECHKLSFSMENRPIYHSLEYSITDIQKELLPILDVTNFPTLSLKSITSFLVNMDPNTYYKNTPYCKVLLDWEVRMLVSLSSYLETVSKNVFVSRVPADSPKKGILEELQYEFPIEVICKWWSLVKNTNVNPNYSSTSNSWASVLSDKISEYYSEQVKADQEMNMPWKIWLTSAVAEALISGFFSSVNKHTIENNYRVELETLTEEGFINQSIIRDVQLLKTLFFSNSNYIYTTPFHRATLDLNELPLSYFGYLHLPATDYLFIKDLLNEEYKRPINYPEIMVGRTLHQIEINKCIYIAYSMNKYSRLMVGNNLRIDTNNLMELFFKYKSTDLTLTKWLEHLQQSIPNANVSIHAIFIAYLSYLKQEARMIKLNSSNNDILTIARDQINDFYSLPLHNELSFTSEPPNGFFPIFEIRDQHDFSEIKIPNINNIVPAPKLNFSRFKGRYWRSKICCFKANEKFLDDLEKIVPSIWPSLGIILSSKIAIHGNKSDDIPQISSESKVSSKYNCNNLSVWQVNRAIYWTGMLQRYMSKGSRLLKENKEMLREVDNSWKIFLKSGKLPKIKKNNNLSFNIFDMCFFYKVANFFYNEIQDNSNSNIPTKSTWEENHRKMPYYLVYLFKSLFADHYENLTYSHIVIFFYELLLEEKRIMALKTRKNGIFNTDIQKLKAVYHAPLVPEPNKLVYPGIYFELDSQFPTNWSKVKKLEKVIIPIVSKKIIEFDSTLNNYFVFGQVKNNSPIRPISKIQSIFTSLISENILTELLSPDCYKYLHPNFASIITKKLPLIGFKWNTPFYKHKNSGIFKESYYWSQISRTFTNGIDWFLQSSTLGLESTFFSSLNIVTSMIDLLKKELFSHLGKTDFLQNPVLLPNIFLKDHTIGLLTQNFENSENQVEISKNFEKICKFYISETGGISYLYDTLFLNSGYSKDNSISQICKQILENWEPNLPFLIPKIRKIFLMEFIRRIKQEDARQGANLIWPTTSTSMFTSEWHLFPKRNSNSRFQKLNNFTGFYNFHYYWDPALLVNIFVTNAEFLNIYFEMDFTSHLILEISQTPLIELSSWISPLHSPLYKKSQLITGDTIKKLFISYISSKNSIDINKAEKTDVNLKHISTLYGYCYDWLTRVQKMSKNEIKTLCRDIDKKYGKIIIYLYSMAHNYEFIFEALLNLIDKHPHSSYTDHLEMQKVYRTKETILASLNNSLKNLNIPKEITIRALKLNVESIIYYNLNIDYSFFQFVPSEMLIDLQKNYLFLYSESFFLNDDVIEMAFNEALNYLRMKTNKQIKIKINSNTSLIDLESGCVEWIDVNSNSIFLLNPKKDDIYTDSISIIDYPQKNKGPIKLNINTREGEYAKKIICETFIDLIGINYTIFSGNKNQFYSIFNNEIKTSSKQNLSEKIIGWHSIAKILNSWIKENFCINSVNIFFNVLTKVSIKNLDQLSQYSLEDFIRETEIDNLGFFFNYETLSKMAIESAYSLGYLLVIKEIPKKNLVSRETDRLKLREIKKKCINALNSPEIRTNVILINSEDRINGNSNKVDFEVVFEKICDEIISKNRKMFTNFVESKSNRDRLIEDLYNKISAINSEVDSTSFSFFSMDKTPSTLV